MSEFTKMRERTTLMMSAGALGILSATSAAPALAQQTPKPVEFDIQSKALSAALKDYSIATDQQVIFAVDLVRDKRAPAVSGAVESGEALSRLLKDTGLSYERTDSNVIVIKPLQQQAMLVQEPARVATLQEVADRDEEIEADDRTDRSPPRRRDEITVTGTLIKGIAPESSPTLTFDRDDIIQSGVTSTEQFIRQLPQNFGGGSTEYTSVGLPNDVNSRVNRSYGSGANLRGLGSGGTLTLLNGRRLAPSSEIGDFVDLSMIPISALERVEVLTDGASSIYGGDAVAGVVNFVLRDDFEGAETSARYGTVTSGDMDEFRASQTAGAAWGSGNIVGTYEFFKRDNLTLADRPGLDPYSLSGGGEIPSDLIDLLPKRTRHSGIIAGKQAITDFLTLDGSALYSRQKVARSIAPQRGTLVVQESSTESESISVSSGLNLEISETWTASLNGLYSRNSKGEDFAVASGVPSLTQLSTRSKLWSVDLLVSGDLVNVPAGEIKVGFGGQIRKESFLAQNLTSSRIDSEGARTVSAVFGEVLIPIIGERNELPFANRLEINASARLDDYSDFGTTVNPKVGVLWSPFDGVNVRGSYGTSFTPPPQGRSEALNYTGSVFPYSYFLSLFSIDPIDPALATVNYLSVGGNSADLGPETSRTFTAGVDIEQSLGQHAFTVKSTYYNIKFQDRLGTTPLPGNLLAPYAPSVALTDPDALPEGTVVFYPSHEQLTQLISSFDTPPLTLFGATLDNIGIINYALVVRNLSLTKTSGMDIDIAYALDNGAGRFGVGLNANYVIDFVQRATVASPAVEVLNTLYSPVDLQLRGRLTYSRGGFRAATFVNYKDGYWTDTTAARVPVSSWTTVDATVGYEIGHSGSSWINGTSVNLSVLNLFDKEPPAVPTLGAFNLPGFDPTNASPLGRFVAIELRKSF